MAYHEHRAIRLSKWPFADNLMMFTPAKQTKLKKDENKYSKSKSYGYRKRKNKSMVE